PAPEARRQVLEERVIERAHHDGQWHPGQDVGGGQELPVAEVGGEDEDPAAVSRRGLEVLESLHSNPREHDVGRTEEVAARFDQVHADVLERTAPEAPDLGGRSLPAEYAPEVVERHCPPARERPPEEIPQAPTGREAHRRGEVRQEPSERSEQPEPQGRRQQAGAGARSAHPSRARMRAVAPQTAAAMRAERGIVSTHAQTISPATPQRTAESRWVAPTPMIEPVMVWVVLTGIPPIAVPISITAPAVSAQNPPIGRSLVSRIPTVLTIRQPPAKVPSPIAACAARITQKGT